MDRPRNIEEGRELLGSLPHLAERVEDFQTWLENEPCTNKLNTIEGVRVCDILSDSAKMCPACRLRLAFFHYIFNAEAYRPELSEFGDEPCPDCHETGRDGKLMCRRCWGMKKVVRTQKPQGRSRRGEVVQWLSNLTTHLRRK